ncbi:sensor histidine kinase [Dyadobacter sp. CY323]|uniref:sensor histidine kinase n=1 Tax=Dyadobacter sp. CY323 TaxID=2907302 RepID=UPI001F24D123|nr:sensor histidine kinase [Dyadobacter sp. CY323]MCE6987955.1 histidine kinase [Dyadobacter sp. CY323]
MDQKDHMTTAQFLSFYNNPASGKYNRVTLSVFALVLAGVLPLAGNIIWGSRYFSNARIFVAGNLFNLAICLVSYLVNSKFARAVAMIYPEPNQSVKRVLSWFLMFATVNIVAFFTALAIYNQAHLFGYTFQLTPALWSGFGIIGGSLTAAGLTELVFAFSQWKIDLQELNQMEQKQLQTELDAVKQQVNPHFLFNCLNSLSVLISEAPSTAEKFVDEMSKVYRYLLNVYGPDKENDLVTLDAELRFVRSYIYLLETRYETGIHFSIHVAEAYLTGELAPLTLQILIDNAVKHNVVSADRPLEIEIKTTQTGQLQVTNSLQKRIVSMSHGEAGLAALISRYKFLFNQAGKIQVKEAGSHFSVILPLIYT